MKSKTSLILFTAVLSIGILACLGGGQTSSSQSEDDPLLGTGWILEEYRGTALIAAGNRPTITFSGELASGNAGCNGWNGSYTIDGTDLNFGELETSEIFCETPEGIMDQEDVFLQMLGDSDRYELEGDTLTIFTSSGETLIFTKMGS
jgi:heat shock protein HslJ